MATPKKEAAIIELKEDIGNATISIMSKYQGITVEEVSRLRAQLRDSNIKFKVFKNSLAKRALDELELNDASQYLDGPTVWAFSEDPVAPAKILKDFSKNVEFISMQAGILDGEVVDGATLQSLADLPSRDQLIAQVVGTIAMPLRNLVGTLNAVPRNMVNVIEAIRKQKEESGEAA